MKDSLKIYLKVDFYCELITILKIINKEVATYVRVNAWNLKCEPLNLKGYWPL